MEAPVRTVKELCSRYRCAKSRCAACVEVCPVPDAVRISEEGATVTRACVSCGACVSACPNGALQPVWTDRSVALRIRALTQPGHPFRIACPRAAGPADLTVSCLSRLTEALLLEPLRWGALRIDILDPGCVGCSLEAAAPQWRRTFALAQELAGAAGVAPDRIARVRVLQKPAEASAPPVSRRAALNFLAAGVAEVAAAVRPETEPPPPVSPEAFRDVVLRHPENPKRSHLLEVLDGLATAAAKPTVVPREGKPFADLEVTEKCVGCNVCETLCPVGALRRRDEGGLFALEFDPARCTACGVCVVACFPKAIRARDTFDLADLLDRSPHSLIESKRGSCRACRSDFLGNGSEFCPPCRLTQRRQQAAARRWVLGGTEDDRH